MKRYTMHYVLWLTGVTAMGLIALEWYRHVEKIGWAEVWTRINGNPVTETAEDNE